MDSNLWSHLWTSCFSYWSFYHVLLHNHTCTWLISTYKVLTLILSACDREKLGGHWDEAIAGFLSGIAVNTPDVLQARAALLLCSMDLPARAYVMNMKKYNRMCSFLFAITSEIQPQVTTCIAFGLRGRLQVWLTLLFYRMQEQPWLLENQWAEGIR